MDSWNISVYAVITLIGFTLCLANPVYRRDAPMSNECHLQGSVQDNLQQLNAHLGMIPNTTQIQSGGCTERGCQHNLSHNHHHHQFKRYIPDHGYCPRYTNSDNNDLVSDYQELNTAGCTAVWEMDKQEARIPRTMWHAVCQCNATSPGETGHCPLNQQCEAVYREVSVLWRTDCYNRHDTQQIYEYEWRKQHVAFACVCQSLPAPVPIPITAAPVYIQPPGI